MRYKGNIVPDILFPPGSKENNRDEYFLVKFDDILQAQCENILYGLFELPEYSETFPRLEEFKDPNLNSSDIYYSVAVYDKYTFLKYLANDENLSKEFMDEVANKAFSIDTYDKQLLPNMAYALSELVHTDYTKEVTVVFDRPVYEHDLDYLTYYFKTEQTKIDITTDSFLDVLKADKDKKRYTTIMSGNADELWEVIRDHENYHCEDIMLVLCENTSTIDYKLDPLTGKYEITAKYNENFMEAREYFKIKFARYKPEPMLFLNESPELSNIVRLPIQNIPSMMRHMNEK